MGCCYHPHAHARGMRDAHTAPLVGADGQTATISAGQHSLAQHISKQGGVIFTSTRLRQPGKWHTWLGGTPPPALLPAFSHASGWECFSFQLQFPVSRR